MSRDSLLQHVQAFVGLLEAGRTLEAIERFYAEDICVFENRARARAGREACLEYERRQLAGQPGPPQIRVHRRAVDPASGVAFLEYSLRFAGEEGRPMCLEEVAVQRWAGDRIVEERFYYAGLVDEGDESH